MRLAAEPAVAAVRSIAQMVWRVDMAELQTLISSAVRVAEFGKVRVNRPVEALLLTDSGPGNQAAE